ncbi:MAG: alcohol dehydrogenase catalytic domain-containing protein [Sphingobium sp.]
MRIVQVHGQGDVRLDPVAAPVAGPGDVLVRIAACGICGTDLTFVKQGGTKRAFEGPMPLGHEAAGEVTAVGAGVEGVQVGQRVIINPMGTSAVIGNGGPEGAFTEELLVREARLGTSLLPIPDDLPYDLAALTEPLAVALHGVNRADPAPDEKVVVFGCGPIGLGVVLWLAERGVKDVVAIDLHDSRLERAAALGARATIRADREDVEARLAELHGRTDVLGRPAVGTQVYIDAAGGPGIVPQVVAMARSKARLMVIAAYRTPVPLDLQAMLISEMSIATSVGYPDELPVVLAALPRLADKVRPLISHRFPFDRVIEGFGVAGQADAAKVMIDFDEGMPA